jgi:hypothetical protein
MLGGVLFVTMAANTETIPSPMLEPASFLFCILIFRALYRSDWRMFVVACSFGVATKEILVVTSLLWVVNRFAVGDRSTRGWLLVIWPALLPVIVFVTIRLALGGGALDVNYGFNLLRGELPLQYMARFLSPWNAAVVIVKLFLAFSFVWLGILNCRNNSFLARYALMIPLVILATVILSSRITRIVGIVYPIVIPAFLMFLERPRTRCSRTGGEIAGFESRKEIPAGSV